MSLINFIVRILYAVVYRIYYERLTIKNKDKLPRKKPYIIVANHTNAFTDPTIITLWSGRFMNFVARSDMFSSPLKNFFMRQMNILPIYRIQEGADQLHKNAGTFKECAYTLKKFQPIIIFSEGLCIQERRMRGMKKGAARIILGAEKENNYEMDIHVVAIGLNYDGWNKFRSNLFVNCSEPYSLKQFREEHKENENVATTNLTRFIGEVLSKQMIIIKNKDNDELVEQIEEIVLDERSREKEPSTKKLEIRYNVSKSIAEMVNRFDENDQEGLLNMKHLIGGYSSELRRLGLKDHLIASYARSDALMGRLIGRIIIQLLGLPVYLFGAITSYLPYTLSERTADKAVKNIEFHSSVKIVAGSIIFPLYYYAQLKILAAFVESPTILYAFLISAPIAGLLSFYYWKDLQKLLGLSRLIKLEKNDKSLFEELVSTRKKIIDLVEVEIDN